MILLVLLCLQLFSCQNQTRETSAWLEISGRNGTPTYRIKVPENWVREFSDHTKITDTTRPLMAFRIAEGEIRITIHNFPLEKEHKRIPPTAQIARWKRQFDQLDPSNISITPQSSGGFTGYLFEGTGLLEGKTITTLAWIMQLTPNYFSNLEIMQVTYPQKHEHYQQVQADYTIKASGPPELIDKYRQAIFRLAQSFELIEELST